MGLLSEAESCLREALASWAQAPTVYPLQDLAIWPLVSLLLDTGRPDEAGSQLICLADESQRRFSDELDADLQAFRRMFKAGDPRAVTAIAELLDRARSEALH